MKRSVATTHAKPTQMQGEREIIPRIFFLTAEYIIKRIKYKEKRTKRRQNDDKVNSIKNDGNGSRI